MSFLQKRFEEKKEFEAQFVPFDKDWWAIGAIEPEIHLESIAYHSRWETEPPIALWVSEQEQPILLKGKKVPVDTFFEQKPVIKWRPNGLYRQQGAA